MKQISWDTKWNIEYAKKYGIRRLEIGEVVKKGDIGYAQPGAKSFIPTFGIKYNDNMHPIYRKISKEDIEPFYLKGKKEGDASMRVSLYYKEKMGRLYHGDCFEVMKKMPNNKIDLIVTDPPYGYNFMGKDWDKAVIKTEVWKECLRVLKPGGFAFIMSAPRQDVLSKMICNLTEAGFKMNFTSIYWGYSSGFPKAINVSKVIDKKIGEQRKSNNPISNESKSLNGAYGGFQPKPAVEIIIVCMKPLDKIDRNFFWKRDKYEYFYNSKVKINGKTKDGIKQKSKLEKKYNIKLNHKDIIERRIAINPKNNDEIILNRKTVLMSAKYKNSDLSGYVFQAMKNGGGVTWLDSCRIPFTGEKDKKHQEDIARGQDNAINGKFFGGNGKSKATSHKPIGRYPANLLVSNDILNNGQIYASGKDSKTGYTKNKDSIFGRASKDRFPVYGNAGSFSRYFDLDKWWRNRIKYLPLEVKKTFPFLISKKACKAEKNKGCEKLIPKVKFPGLGNTSCVAKETTVAKNFHPTVKPIKLMAYLIMLGSRPNDITLDPFTGSGTTCVSAKILNRKWIGIDSNKEYCKISSCRIKGK